MIAAGLQLQHLDCWIINNAHPRRTSSGIEEVVRSHLQSSASAAHQDQDAFRTHNAHPARAARQVVTNSHAKILARRLDCIARMVEQRLALAVIDRGNCVAAETYANAG